MRLTQVLDDRVYVLKNKVKNTIVFYLLWQAIVKGTASSTFSRNKYLDNKNAAWNLLIERYEEAIQQEPEAKWVRAFLANLWLDLRTSGYKYQNKFQEYVQRLEGLGSIASKSTCVDWFIDYIQHPDYNYVVESLKGTTGVDLNTCYM